MKPGSMLSFSSGQILIVVMLVCLATAAQADPPSGDDYGSLVVGTRVESWPTPEALVADLRSSDPQKRLASLRLLGLSEDESYRKLWAQASPPTVVDREVVIPDKVQLTYAALGSDPTQQAIVAIQAGQMTHAALAVSSAHGWTRIANFSCWCKYEMNGGEDTLAEFVQLVGVSSPVLKPQRFELVLRASGGGSGIYVQDEVHFRVVNGKLRSVLQFVSDRLACPMGESCNIEKRWFVATPVHGKPGGVLVEARGQFPQTTGSFNPGARELYGRYLEPANCRAYSWDEVKQAYWTNSAPQSCGKFSTDSPFD